MVTSGVITPYQHCITGYFSLYVVHLVADYKFLCVHIVHDHMSVMWCALSDKLDHLYCLLYIVNLCNSFYKCVALYVSLYPLNCI